MKANDVNFLDFLEYSPQITIPIYQRKYDWEERECSQLWNDIMRVGHDSNIPSHFFGSIVIIKRDPFLVADTKSELQVIDGQQRLTTVLLILEALSRHLEGIEKRDDVSPEDIRDSYLVDSRKSGDFRFKILLTETDRKTMVALLQQGQLPLNKSVRIDQNFAFFEEKIEKLGDDITPLWIGLRKLMVVQASLERGRDNPQLIFESMNSTGRDLSQGDLIRNYILLNIKPKLQKQLYDSYWRPMEELFGQEAYREDFDGFMRHYLTLHTHEIPKIKGVYEAFKKYFTSSSKFKKNNDEANTEALLDEMYIYAKYYCTIATGREKDNELAQAFRNLRDLKVDVAFPLLLELYHDYTNDILSKLDFLQALHFIESYVFRRLVCSIPTNSLNTTFSTFGRSISKEGDYLESIKAHFLTLESYRRFPDEREFKRELKKRNLYKFSRRSYWLDRLENHGRKERVYIHDYTVEHILPQNPNLPIEWINMLGQNWREIQNVFLHTLGNLTLTGYNSEYSDHSFSEKMNMKGGFLDSPLKLNKELRSFDAWNEEAIRERAEHLASEALKVWGYPVLPEDVFEKYRPKDKRHQYSLSDHQHLSADSPQRPLFDRIRGEILALDPCVTEKILKRYVAYKAETNFVDIIPLKSRLCLVLNLRFHELNDPRNLAKDITNLGRWGNGDIEVSISKERELPYVMGLVIQAFEKQI